MNGKMTASTLAALGILFQAACGAAPDSDTAAPFDPLSGAYTPDLAEEALRFERATMPAESGGADRLYRGDFLFGGQMLQDPTCNFTLQMRTDGGLNTWSAGWYKMPNWGAGNSSAYNYAAYWYATEEGGNGNFLVLNRSGYTLWESNTWSSGSYTVVQQSDANVVMYVSGGYVPWASNQVSGPWGSLCGDPNYNTLVGTKTWMRPHKDFSGMDYWHAATTLGQCGSYCATDANCHSFTYYNGVCWLKSGHPGETNLSNAFSGRKLIGNYTWY